MDDIKGLTGLWQSESNRAGKHTKYLGKQRKLVDFANEVKVGKKERKFHLSPNKSANEWKRLNKIGCNHLVLQVARTV